MNSGKDEGVLGVDPGFGGAIAYVNLSATEVMAIPMPVTPGTGRTKTEIDVSALATWIRTIREHHDVRLAVVERVHAFKGQGVTSMFRFGMAYGTVLGVLQTLGIPLELPSPQAWKKVVLRDTAMDKDAAVAYVVRRFPHVSLLANERCRVAHVGVAEAICLGEFGRRLLTAHDGNSNTLPVAATQ